MTIHSNIVTGDKAEGNKKDWENPKNPEAASDSRDEEQVERQFEEAKRRKDNLTETDHIDKPNKTE